MNLQDIIEGYTVDLDTDMEGHGADHPDRVTGCWIMLKLPPSYESYSASLEALLGEGCLTASSGRQWALPQSTIDQIESWALGHGY